MAISFSIICKISKLYLVTLSAGTWPGSSHYYLQHLHLSKHRLQCQRRIRYLQWRLQLQHHRPYWLRRIRYLQ